MKTQRCSGDKGHWECVGDYPDHIIPVTEFALYRSGRASRCRRCRRYYDNTRNSIISAAENIVGSQKDFRAMTKEQRSEIFALVIDGNAVDTTPRYKSEFGQSTPMTKRETTVVEGEQVPEGWVYVVYNPDVPSVLKIGKTFPDGIPSIMSSARRFGRAELADKFWFDEAYKAEQAIHTVLSSCNLRALGYSDCGVELFKCNIEEVRGAIENAIR